MKHHNLGDLSLELFRSLQRQNPYLALDQNPKLQHIDGQYMRLQKCFARFDARGLYN